MQKWIQLCHQRSTQHTSGIEERVIDILDQVKQQGDDALKKLTRELDGAILSNLQVSHEEIASASDNVSSRLKEAIQLAAKNITKFHESQKERSEQIYTTEGVVCWRKSIPIERVGLYIPGGSAPLFSTVLMLGIPAVLAGCKEVIACTPPSKDGGINPIILYTASLVGISTIFKIGGAQAIAAMAYGTQSVPSVYKLFGPGNQYVTKAKELAQRAGLAIDLPAGPSEVLIIADSSCAPRFVAADLMAQAEHGIDSHVVLLTDKKSVIENVQQEIENQIPLLSRKKIVKKVLGNSYAVQCASIEECFIYSNHYAPEHLVVASTSAERYTEHIINAGSVFLGNYSCESVGDYASGTNHTLPTNGHAKHYSGVSLDSFLRKVTFQNISSRGIKEVGKAVITMAEAEGLDAHSNAVEIRLGNGKTI